MASTFSADDIRAAAERLAAAAQRFADELNTADAALGDGDLGITVANGFREVAARLGQSPAADVGAAFLMAAQAFQAASSSSFGTLTATAFLGAARLTKGQGAAALSTVPALLQAALDGMMKRGKAELGDKTVLDSLSAAIAATEGLEDGAGLRAAASRAAVEAIETFRGKPNRIGRARMFGDDSRDLVDPGMLAFARLAEAV